MSAQTYNGWANYETWNVTLWMQNDVGLYELARQVARFGGTYQDFVVSMEESGLLTTPDGVAWDDVNINGIEVNETIKEMYD